MFYEGYTKTSQENIMPSGKGGFMNIAILIFLILNFIFFAIIVTGLIISFNEAKLKNIKKIGELEAKNKTLESQVRLRDTFIYEEKKKNPLKAKFNLGQSVVAIVKDELKRGCIKAVIVYESNRVEYRIKVSKTDKEIQVAENCVYSKESFS